MDGNVITLKGLPQLAVVVLDSGNLRRMNVPTFHELWDKRRVFLIVLRLLSEEISRSLLQGGIRGKHFTVPENEA